MFYGWERVGDKERGIGCKIILLWYEEVGIKKCGGEGGEFKGKRS